MLDDTQGKDKQKKRKLIFLTSDATFEEKDNLKSLTTKLNFAEGILINQYHYENFQDLKNYIINNKIKRENTIIIFLELPKFLANEILSLRNNSISLLLIGDISEKFESCLKYAQFLFDGLLLQEILFRGYFEVYGTLAYDGSFLNNELIYGLNYKKHYKELIPWKERKYDFSFIGNINQDKAINLLYDIKKEFPNSFIHDTTKSKIDNKYLKEVLEQSRYGINTAGKSKHYSYKDLPSKELKRLYSKTRIIPYTANGCIIFTKRFPGKRNDSFLKVDIPMIEINDIKEIKDIINELRRSSIDSIEVNSKGVFYASLNKYGPERIAKEFNKLIDKIKGDHSHIVNNSFLQRKELKIINRKIAAYLLYSNILQNKNRNASKAIFTIWKFLQVYDLDLKIYIIAELCLRIISKKFGNQNRYK